MGTTGMVLVAGLAALMGAILAALLLRGRGDAPQAADTAGLAALVQQQIESMRGQLREALDAGAAATNRQLDAVTRQMAEATGQMDRRLEAVTRQVNDRLRENSETLQGTQKIVGERLESTAQVMGRVENRLGRVEEVNRRVFEVGQDIASLQEILRAPKLRGNLGELFLGDLLAQILSPPHFELQYAFKSGAVVDAVIRLGQGMVPIDSKFPLENFQKMMAAEDDAARAAARRTFAADVKKHAAAIADKYILPDEGTFDFALMYIPAENVFYETIIRDDAFGGEKSISEYAMKRRVIPVSPNSFYAYLMALVTGLKGLRIEESAREIMSGLDRLRGEFARIEQNFGVLGKHIRNAAQTCERADKDVEKFRARLDGLAATADSGAGSAAPEPPQELPGV